MPEAIPLIALDLATAGAAGGAVAGLAGLEAAAAGFFGITIYSQTALNLALVGVGIGLQAVLAKNQATSGLSDAAAPAESGHVPLKQAIAPRIRGYGRSRLAGSYVLYEANNHDSYDIVIFHHGRIGGIVGCYLHDDVVVVDGGIVQEQGDGRYANNLISVEIRLGEATETAFSSVVGALPDIWTTDHRGDGLASAALICLGAADPSNYTQVYPRGLPQLSIVADLSPIYDARDAAQALDDPASWAVSKNPVVQIIDFLTNVDSGMGFDRATLIDPVIDALNAEADICDEAVFKADGSFESRYTSNGFYSLSSDPINTLQAMLDACDGWMSENGDGSLALKVGKYREATFVIEAEHVLGFGLRKGVENEELVNEISLTYTEPQADFKTLPGDPWRDEDDISARGKTQSQPFDLSWVQSHTQARRLAKRKMSKINALQRGSIRTTSWGLQALGERWIKIDASKVLVEFDEMIVEVQKLRLDLANNQVTIDFVEVDAATMDAWSPAEDGEPPTIPSKAVYAPPPVPTGVLATYTAFFPIAFFLVQIDDPGRSDLTYEMRYRTAGSGSAFTIIPIRNYAGAPSFGVPGRLEVTFLVFLPLVSYEVQIRSFAPGGVASDWSASAFT